MSARVPVLEHPVRPALTTVQWWWRAAFARRCRYCHGQIPDRARGAAFCRSECSTAFTYDFQHTHR